MEDDSGSNRNPDRLFVSVVSITFLFGWLMKQSFKTVQNELDSLKTKLEAGAG